jgi:transcriptional regulator with XRE-family HTH domain
MNTVELAHEISTRRKALRLSQQALAKAAGLSRNYISMIEREEAKNISTKVIEQLAVALNVTPAQLMGAHNGYDRLIPPALREFALSEDLSYDVVDRLASIPKRGQEPKTKEAWRELYELIQPYLKPPVS